MNTMQTNPQDILKTLSLSFEVFPPMGRLSGII